MCLHRIKSCSVQQSDKTLVWHSESEISIILGFCDAIHQPDHLGVGGGVEPRLEEPDCRDGGAVVVERREEAVVAAHVEHVDQTVAARRRQQAEKQIIFGASNVHGSPEI